MKERPVIEVHHLKKYFPVTSGIFRRHVSEIKAVDDISFEIFPGEILGLVGESGCGKSTTGRAIIRLIEPTSGNVYFLGQDLLAMDPFQLQAMRPKVQMVFQNPYASLNPRHPVGDSIGEALFYHKIVVNKKEAREYVAHIMKQVGLSPDLMERYPHEFSGGQQQRVCIGRAIAMNPRLIICDEALASLDISVQAQILNLLVELKERLGFSYLFISHDLSTVQYLCNRVLVMYYGKVVESGTIEEVFSHPQHPYTRTLLAAIPRKNF
jgi:ABC-type oligopeptide transport system ATPase subunit